jgi:FG-GAP repeat
MLRFRTAAVLAALTSLAAPVAAVVPAAAAPPRPHAAAGGAVAGGGGDSASGDFDGDGFADLAVAAPSEDVGDILDAGNVTVAYGTASGLTASGAEVVRQGLSGVPGVPEQQDWFGSAVSAGDFDGDGFDDLAVGASQEDSGSILNSGNVTVVYGTASGLIGGRSQVLRHGLAPVGQALEEEDWFGETTAVGDVDGDGFDDLVVAAPFEDVGSVGAAGNASLVFGSATGLGGGRATVTLRQGLGGLPGTAEALDFFGLRMTVGDFDGDGFDDVAASAPGEAVGTVAQAGNVTIVPGAPGGPALMAAEPLNAGDTECACVQAGAGFGSTVAAGDVNVDTFEDLAVGSPFWDKGSVHDAGMVTLVFGTPERVYPAMTRDQSQLHQAVEADDQFSWNLVLVDVTADGVDDLIAGAAREDVGATVDAGLITVIEGAGAEFPGDATSFHQGSFGGALEPFDVFGLTMSEGDFDGNGRPDLVVAAPGEDVGSTDDAGNVTVVYGTSTGLPGRPVPYNQGSFAGLPELGDSFGLNLS